MDYSASATVPTPNPDFEARYDLHCGNIVPRKPLLPDRLDPPGYGGSPSPLRVGCFRGGAPLLNQNPANDVNCKDQSIYFYLFNPVKTNADGVYQFRARLSLRDSGNSTRRGLRLVRFRGPKSPIRRRLRFSLVGFWSETSRKLCMVGRSGSAAYSGIPNYLFAALKLNYPLNSTIYNSLVTGTLESLAKNDSSNYFAPISLMAFSQDSSYEYTLLGKENGGGCLNGDEIGESLSLKDQDKCSILNGDVERFDLEYGSDCNGGVDCNPLGGSLGYVPNYMYYRKTRCTDGTKWQMLLSFPNSTFDGLGFPFTPSTTLVAEGAWNTKENRFCAVACRISNYSESFANAYVGDCSTGFSLSFPVSLSLQNRSTVVGKIWNTSSNVNNSSYFGKIGFRSFNVELLDILGFKYDYTTGIDSLRRICRKKNTARGKGKTYPAEYSSDMRFRMSVRNSEEQVAWGYSTPFYVRNQFFRTNLFLRGPTNSQQVMQTDSSVLLKSNQSSLVNISYRMSLNFPPDFKFSHGSSLSNVEISAEGTYDRDTGVLCMIGCRNIGSTTQNLVTNATVDCAITVNVQFSPLNANSDKNIRGSIESTRQTSDPFYFGRLELSSKSLYSSQAAASIWRMDLEITMVLISNTLTCVFVGLQLFYIKSHPDALPFISIVMLIIFTMGSLIPLLLNFEALFVANHSQQNVFLGSGGWLEVNEVIVRIVTLIAFLLQLRLLQLTWSSRQGDGSEKGLWNTERKVLFVTLPIYVVGALIAWFVSDLKNSSGVSHRPFLNSHHKFYVVSPRQMHSFQGHSLWEDLKSYAGLVLDGFLLPQILFNLFSNSGEKALAPLFYTGTTLVRLLPHAYDLYRAHAYASYLNLSYIYASHIIDFYSTAWNIVIPFGGLLFAVLISLQQRFGGRFILPRRFRQSSVYEKVPVISNEDL
ncbi:hypothetical protein TorRG33x02_041960 [Trema orientale]|uniref:RING-type E3 ubiquitin transferase n=1 Tax=Trema orientale TaxID=63057 RepID=A0A2P5FQJ7_TREOI|nr:hypothetical protein TorRG33x02_041960 [Trema orientale]